MMMKIQNLLILIVAATLTFIVITTSPNVVSAKGRAPGSLLDLLIPEDRVPQWIDLDYLPLDTSGWNEVVLTCGDFDTNFLTPLQNSPDQTVLIIPAGCTFTVDNSRNFYRGEIVVRGADRETSRLEFSRTQGGGSMLQIREWDSEGPFGDARAWTAGYEMGDDVMTVAHTGGLNVGDWVHFRGIPEPDWFQNATHSYTSKLVCVGPSTTDPLCPPSEIGVNQIKIDTELHTPFTQGGQEVLRITLPDEYSKNVGFENLTFTHTSPGVIDKYVGYISLKWCFECWITDVIFEEAGNVHAEYSRGTTRTVMRGNYHARVNCWDENALGEGIGGRCNWNKGVVYFQRDSSDNVFENNIVWQSPNGATDQGGTGNVIAYNYMTKPAITLNPNDPHSDVDCARHVFLHGNGTNAALTEGNDVECGMQWDTYRDGQGYYQTFFKNRLRGTDDGGYAKGRMGGEYLGKAINRNMILIGNHLNELQGSPFPDYQWNWSNDPERDNIDGWASYTIARTNIIHDTTGYLPTRATEHNNFTRTSPHPDWVGFAHPASLYRNTEAPSWWCEESGPWGNSIGAWNDAPTNAGGYNPLPAQLRAEFQVCTPVGDVIIDIVEPTPPITPPVIVIPVPPITETTPDPPITPTPPMGIGN
jgi:hypothetical protein